MVLPVQGKHGDDAGLMPKPAPACTLVIFGAGGDLTKRLLVPALYNLAVAGLIDDRTEFLGVDHGESSDESWRDSLSQMMASFTQDPASEFHPASIDQEAWAFVRDRLHYLQGDFLARETYVEIGARLSGSAIFYFAVASRFFAPIAEHLGAAGLLKQASDVFRRIIVEKPFGRDLASAQALNASLLKLADESQIYRIDHFLGKETVQSIMALRFANGVFEPLWRREHIDHVEITVSETIGVEQRGGFYEPTGALRDMVPNHLFQLLCMIAMEPPNSFEAEAVRDEKAKLIEAIRPLAPQDAVRGQYGAGAIAGQAHPAYRTEPNVAADSRTETYVALKLTIETWRWAGVPFYLRTGKRMAERRSEIAICFRPAPYQPFRDTPVDTLEQNILRLQVDPEQGTRMTFNVKIPGPVMRLGTVSARFRADDFFAETPYIGYETLLYDCMIGDATLFQRADGIEAAWAVVDPILAAWTSGEPQPYEAGTAGPADADALLAREGRRWLPLDDTKPAAVP